MIVEDFERGVLALVVWRLAGNDGLDSMLAIACTLANKVKAGKKSWLEVIGNELTPGSMPDTREPSFVKLLQSVDAIYEGRARDASNGASLYVEAGTPPPLDMTLCCRVGRWSFFR